MANANSTSIPSILTGYGPSSLPIGNILQCAQFSGKREDFNAFRLKFKAYLRSVNLGNIIENEEEPDTTKNSQIFDILVQCLDDDNTNLLCSIEGDGKTAWQQLLNKYLGNRETISTNALINITNLKLENSETIDQYIARVDHLKKICEDNKVLNRENSKMVTQLAINGLPSTYSNWVDIIQANGTPTYDEFKQKLQNYEARLQNKTSNPAVIMNVDHRKKWCKFCRKSNHNTSECTSDKWCDFCRTSTHHTHECYSSNNNRRRQHPSANMRSHRGGRNNAYSGSRNYKAREQPTSINYTDTYDDHESTIPNKETDQ